MRVLTKNSLSDIKRLVFGKIVIGDSKVDFTTEEPQLGQHVSTSTRGLEGQAAESNRTPVALGRDEYEVFTEDPACFLIANMVMMGNCSSLSGLKNYFAGQPELHDVIDQVVSALEHQNRVNIEGDRIVLNAKKFFNPDEPEKLERFLPQVMKSATKRVLDSAKNGLLVGRRESAHYFVLPDDPIVAQKARGVYLKFLTEMNQLVLENKVGTGSAVRFVGVVNSSLEPEDVI